MITPSDSFYTYDLENILQFLPATHRWSLEDYKNHFNASLVDEGFSYNSGTNTDWETVDSLKQLIKKHVN